MAKPIKINETTYRLTVYSGYDRRGNQIRHRKNYHIKEKAPSKIEKELMNAQVEFEQEIRRKTEDKYYESTQTSFESYVKERWLPWAEKNNKIKQRTLEGYESVLKNHIYPVLGEEKMSDITSVMIESVYNKMLEKGLSAKTCRHAHEIISSAFARALRSGFIKENPCQMVDLPEADDEYDFEVFTEDQTSRFIKALSGPMISKCPERHRINSKGELYTIAGYDSYYFVSTMFQAFFTLALGSAMRRGEECALTWKDIDFNKKTVRINKAVTKTRKEGETLKAPKTKAGIRTITIPDTCIEILKDWKKEYVSIMENAGNAWMGYDFKNFERNFVFIQTKGKTIGERVSVDTVTGKFKQILKAYNNQFPESDKRRLPIIRLHDLRHTSASLLLANGADIVTVSKRLGHEKPTTTLNIYSHLISGKDKIASDILQTLF